MRAAWYERPGTPAVLEVGEMATPEPGPGDVRVRVRFSGVNPGDTKKRSDWLGYGMPFPRVVPHSDGSGVVDAVGEGVDARRVGQRVWIYGAQSYRPFGTAAELTVVPADQAVELPPGVGDEVGACLGIPGITAHRAVFADGPVAGRAILVQGVLGGVGLLAAQLARWGGATVLGTVRRSADLDRVDARSPMRSRSTRRILPRRYARTRPRASIESSKCPSRTMRTSMRPCSPPVGSSPSTRAATTGRRARSGRCSSPT